jgi:hypothetical protein
MILQVEASREMKDTSGLQYIVTQKIPRVEPSEGGGQDRGRRFGLKDGINNSQGAFGQRPQKT